MPAVKQSDFSIEILTTVEALKKDPSDYEMIFSVEDFVTEGVYVLEDDHSTAVQQITVDHDAKGNPLVRETALQLLSVWRIVSDKRKVMIHCKNGEFAAALALFILAVRTGEGAEDRAVAELFVQCPNAACDETLVGLFDDYLGRKGDLADAWANGVFSVGLNPFRLLLAESRAWMQSNNPNKASAA